MPTLTQSGLLLDQLNATTLFVDAPAGGGKSTFCRWAALQSLSDVAPAHSIQPPQGFAEKTPENLRNRLPLLIPLREFARSMECGQGRRTWRRPDLERAVAKWINDSPPDGLSGTLLRAHLDAGSAFLLLDGLDEVAVSEQRDATTVYPRELLLSGLADALPIWEKAGNRTLLTSRPYGLDEAWLARLQMQHAPLKPLPKRLQELFVKRWFHTLGKEEVITRLLDAMRARPEIEPLVENPLLLTAVCVLYDNGGALPEDRYELYRGIVNVVLHSRYAGDAREREPVLRRLEAIAYGMHTGDPDGPKRKTPAAEISWVEVESLLAHFANLNAAYEQEGVEVAKRREDLLNRSGLLVPRLRRRASFYHLSFQEFLAAQRMTRIFRDLDEVFLERGIVEEWRLTLMFLFAAQISRFDAQWGVDLLTRMLTEPEPRWQRSDPAMAALIAEAFEFCHAKGYRAPSLATHFRSFVLGAIESEVELRLRQTLALTLGRVGDPRIFELGDPRAYVEVAAGSYVYGDERESIEIGAPFWLGRYPVTNSQYRAFIEDGGYLKQRWWSDRGWAWLQKEQVTEPAYWQNREWNTPSQPVVGVSFFEAEAFSTWMHGRLPTEQEWESAARGAEGRTYAWGERWQDGICNTSEIGLGSTSPVGLFPRSRSPLGFEDLAGNVWEWCQTQANAADAAEGDSPRTLRGASWYESLGFARCTFRVRSEPFFRNNHIGFRVLRSSPLASCGL